MPDEIHIGLLIPGTASTALSDDAGRELGHPADAETASGVGALLGRGLDEVVDTLGMEHIPGQWAPVRTSRVPGRSLQPGHALESSFYTQIPEDYVHFLYDWRADLRYNAERLLDFLQTRKRPEQRWNVVAHSQGGLLVAIASKMLDDPTAFAELADSVSLVGVPFAGALPAANSLLTGEPIGQMADGLVDGAIRATRALFSADDASDELAKMRGAMRTWPSLYQMLPNWDAVVSDDGGSTRAGPDLLDPDTWHGQEGISHDLLARATETHDLLRKPLAHLQGPVRVRVLLARNRNTPVAFVHTGGTLTSEIGTLERGDTVVPFDITRSHVLDADDGEVVVLDDECKAHAYLLCDEGAWDRARFHDSASSNESSQGRDAAAE